MESDGGAEDLESLRATLGEVLLCVGIVGSITGPCYRAYDHRARSDQAVEDGRKLSARDARTLVKGSARLSCTPTDVELSLAKGSRNFSIGKAASAS